MTEPFLYDRDGWPLVYARGPDGALYALPDEELFAYGSEDWDGPHKGKHGGTYWISRTGSHRRVYSQENPGGKGDAHRKRIEEGQRQRAEAKATGAQHRAGQKEWERHFKGKQAEEDKAEKAGRPARNAASAHALISDMMERVKRGETIGAQEATAFSQELLGHLAELPVKDIQALKERHGLKASGVKAQLALKIAGAALRPPRPARAKPPLAAAQGPAPWQGGAVEPGKVYNAPTAALAVDPTRFQFKLNTDASGVTDELKDVKTFNPDFAGVVSVWQDPADGKTYVVNGHHRHELAARTGHPDLAVRYVQAATAKEARAVGALVNIAEGRGTAIDAAKFMRDMGETPEQLAQHGVSLKGKLAQDAAALVNLNDRQFDRLARGLLAPDKALAVARHLKDPELQDQLFRLLEQREDAGKDLSPRVIEEMAREMAETPTQSKTEASLFGDIESTESLFVPRNELKAHVRGELAREVRDFLAVASKRRAGRVEGAGNVLNVEENKRIAEEAARVQHVYEKLVNRKGAVSDALNEAAAALASGKTKGERDAARKRAVEAVRNAVFAEAGVGGGTRGAEAQPAGVAGGGAGGDAAGAGQPAAPAAADAGPAAADVGGAGERAAGVEAGEFELNPDYRPAGQPAPSRGTPLVSVPDDMLAGALVRSGIDVQTPAGKRALEAMEKAKAAGRLAKTQEEANAVVEGFQAELGRLKQSPPDGGAGERAAGVSEPAPAVPEKPAATSPSTPGKTPITNELLAAQPPEVRDWLDRKATDTVEEAIDSALRIGQKIPPGVRQAFPAPFAQHEQALGSHAAALAALPVGDLQRVGGFNVRRVGENDYRIETPAGQRGSAVQSGAEKDTGHVRGDARKVAAYIEEQTKQQGLHGRARTEALDRVKDYDEPGFMDAAGQERAQQGFAALPEGAAVVSLEEGTHGRTGKIVKDSAGKNRVQLDGEDGFASGYVEPLDARQSWRAPAAKEAGPKQAGLFETPAPSQSLPAASGPSPAAPEKPATTAAPKPDAVKNAAAAAFLKAERGTLADRAGAGMVPLAALKREMEAHLGRPVGLPEFHEALKQLRRERHLRLIAAGDSQQGHEPDSDLHKSFDVGFGQEGEHFIAAERGDRHPGGKALR